jgi:hypothetical protein
MEGERGGEGRERENTTSVWRVYRVKNQNVYSNKNCFDESVKDYITERKKNEGIFLLSLDVWKGSKMTDDGFALLKIIKSKRHIKEQIHWKLHVHEFCCSCILYSVLHFVSFTMYYTLLNLFQRLGKERRGITS